MTQRYNQYVPARPKAKYRILEMDGEFFPQYRSWGFWRYFKIMLPCSSDIVYDREKFINADGATARIRTEIFERNAKKEKNLKRKIVSYFDDTGNEFLDS